MYWLRKNIDRPKFWSRWHVTIGLLSFTVIRTTVKLISLRCCRKKLDATDDLLGSLADELFSFPHNSTGLRCPLPVDSIIIYRFPLLLFSSIPFLSVCLLPFLSEIHELLGISTTRHGLSNPPPCPTPLSALFSMCPSPPSLVPSLPHPRTYPFLFLRAVRCATVAQQVFNASESRRQRTPFRRTIWLSIRPRGNWFDTDIFLPFTSFSCTGWVSPPGTVTEEARGSRFISPSSPLWDPSPIFTWTKWIIFGYGEDSYDDEIFLLTRRDRGFFFRRPVDKK